MAYLSLVEIAVGVGGAAAGLVAGSVGVYLYTRNKIKDSPAVVAQTEPDLKTSAEEMRTKIEDYRASPVERLVPKTQLEKSKRELRTLLLEKELVSAALTRLYEAEAAKEITREEREILGLKYREELKSLDEKILKIDAFIEVGDLETLRDQLLRLVNEKIDSIDKRIERTKVAAGPMLAEIAKPKVVEPPKKEVAPTKPRVPDISDMLLPEAATGASIPAEQANPSPPPEPEAPLTESISVSADTKRRPQGDSQVEELQKDLLEALDRLEKLDIES